ncbi:hypothetical protein [Photobacterium phosphoreum]|jgi:hypothetical protein|uniref:hypothetical protein n=1 Tax=Photobacterium phosphoreum TaxID=659 RepID=UPI0005D36C8C|nr:hypothetical protein [Photobacterium phosphoreum]KJF86984.1 hypothetical protein UB41_08835 [Photobacterium phosphoreum]PQJ91176.1 hypothetical protein BTO21_05440 [Photobacterium phosphoreum]PSV70244.1 hypothetical protein CTM77_12840 [Photobacterium phosphoreum]PSW32193.1 hypothetical protein CTM70_19490 [Photobacterium phosphoreum]
MLTPSELFNKTFTPSDDMNWCRLPSKSPREIVNEIVKNLISKIDNNLQKGIVSFECRTGMNMPEVKNQDVMHQLICKLINDEMNKFGWITYIRMEYETCKIILAVKESDLSSIEILMTETNKD